jgi:UDP-N-acetyl-D-glucosamine/UDP-N-acetyl-D-galactosamine dehydrogenase
MLQNNINVSGSTIGVLGLTFKENCPDIRNSKIFDVVQELKSWGVKVIAVDPWADHKDVEETYGITLGKMSVDCVDSLIVAVGHKEFRELKPEELRSYCKGSSPILADVKSLYNRESLTDLGFSVFRL